MLTITPSAPILPDVYEDYIFLTQDRIFHNSVENEDNFRTQYLCKELLEKEGWIFINNENIRLKSLILPIQNLSGRTSYLGNENKNSSPPSFLLRAEISPLKLKIAFFTIANPRPVPPSFRDLPESTL